MSSDAAPPPPPAPSQPAAPPLVRVRTVVTAWLIILGVVGMVFLLHAVLEIVLVFLLAIVVAEGIRPLVWRLERVRFPKPAAIIAVYIVMLGVIALLLALLVQPLVTQAQQLANDFPKYQNQLQQFINDVQSRLHLSGNFNTQIGNVLGTAKDVLLAIGTTTATVIVNFVIVLVLAFLWLTTSDRLKRFVVDLVPPRRQEFAADVIADMGTRIGGYLRGVVINMVVIGVLAGIAVTVLGLPSPVLLGIFAGVMEAIPIFGPFLGAAPAVLLGFTVSPLYPLLVAGVFLVIQQVESNTLVPVVMNRVVALPPLTVVLALLVGGTLQGVAGALLAVPMAAALQVLVVRVVVPWIHIAQGRREQAEAEMQVRPQAPPKPRRPWWKRLEFVRRLGRPRRR
jgi:predicted PurR-regulated permease PerM